MTQWRTWFFKERCFQTHNGRIGLREVPPVVSPCVITPSYAFYKSVIRRVIATFLLLCMALSVPASAASMRICFIEAELVLPSWSAATTDDSEGLQCCGECSRGTEQPDPCCVDLEELPDAAAPHLPTVIPPAVIFEIPTNLDPSPVITETDLRSFSPSEPIRGPSSPAAYRAVLGIWRL